MLSSDLEATVYAAMSEKLSEFHTLTARAKTAEVNPKLTALKVELAHVEAEIDKLLNTLTGANDVLISYVNTKITELDSRRQTLVKDTAELAAAEVSPERMIRLSEFLDNWDETGIDEKRVVVDALIERVGVAEGNVDIEWKI
jgi:hypothetical protein